MLGPDPQGCLYGPDPSPTVSALGLMRALPKAHSEKDLPKEREDETPHLWR